MKKESPFQGRAVVLDTKIQASPKSSMPRRQRGFGALEMMIVIIIAIVGILGAVAWYTKLNATSNNQAELENVSTLITNIKTLRTASGYGASGSLNQALISADGIPGTMQISGTSVYNAWGGTVAAASTGSGYTLTYDGLPAAACIFLATKSPTSSATGIKINGGSAINGEVNQSTAATGCSSDSNSLVWSGR